MELLNVQDLHVQFYTDDGIVRAVDGLSFSIDKGKTLGIVGESGCGKSMTALAILRLIPSPGKIVSGKILFEGKDLLSFSDSFMPKIRGGRISMIFQDPMTSLNPVFTIGDQIAETVMIHQKVGKREAMRRAIEMLDRVKIANPEERCKAYPHQLSGGMRQRAMIAMALSCNPSLLIADEPTTALDVTVQAQILELMQDLQKEFHTSIILITHNLGIVAEMCEEVLVMYAGRTVERAPAEALFKNPRHPYTLGLLTSIPRLDEKGERRLVPIDGQPPVLREEAKACTFAPRCKMVVQKCWEKEPGMFQVVDPRQRVEDPRQGVADSGQGTESNHESRCFFHDQVGVRS